MTVYTKKYISIVIIVISIVVISCKTVEEPPPPIIQVPVEIIDDLDIAGSAWIRSLEGTFAANQADFEGFHLTEDGLLLYINIYSMTGNTWNIEGDKLTMTSQSGSEQESEKTMYRSSLKNNTLTLYSDGGDPEGISYERIDPTQNKPDWKWILQYLKKPEAIVEPDEFLPYFELAKTDSGYRIHGFAGVNQFNGTVKTEKDTWHTGLISSTMMAGPFLDYEQLFLKTLEAADRFLRIKNHLFLYTGTEITAHLTKSKYTN